MFKRRSVTKTLAPKRKTERSSLPGRCQKISTVDNCTNTDSNIRRISNAESCTYTDTGAQRINNAGLSYNTEITSTSRSPDTDIPGTCNTINYNDIDTNIPAEVKKISVDYSTGETILHKAARVGYLVKMLFIL